MDQGAAQGPAFEISGLQKSFGANRVLRGIDLAIPVGHQNRHQTTACHNLRHINTTYFEEGRCKIHQIYKVIHNSGNSLSRQGNDQRNLSTEIIEIAFSTRKSRGTVVTTDYDHCVIHFTGFCKNANNF